MKSLFKNGMSAKPPGRVSERIGHSQVNGLGNYNRKQDHGDTYIKDEGCQSKESWKMHLGLRFKEPSLWIILLLTEFSGGSGLTVPSNTIAVNGDTVILNCSSDSLQPVFWEKIPFGLGAYQQKTIYFGKHGLNQEFAPRYNVSISKNAYDLIITNVEMSDAGKYLCIKENALGDIFCAEIVVTEGLECLEDIPPDDMMGENIFGIPQRSGSLQCDLKYRGNTEPALRWKRNGSNLVHTQSSVKIIAGVISSSIVITSAQMNGEVFTCQASLPNDKTAADFGTSPGLQWVSKPLVVKYAHLKNQPIETCPGSQTNLICNPPCNYSIHVIQSGKYICNATYTFENLTFVYANNTYICETDERTANLFLAFISIALVAALILFIASTYFAFRRNNRRKLRQNGSAGDNENHAKRRLMNTTTEVTPKIRDEEKGDETSDVGHSTRSTKPLVNDVKDQQLISTIEPTGECSKEKGPLNASKKLERQWFRRSLPIHISI